MKTWQQFNEDVQSYAKDKEAYERATASAQKLSARRDAALKKSKSSGNFTSRMKRKMSEIKRKSQAQKSEYESDKEHLDAVRERERAISKKTVRQGASMFNAGAKAGGKLLKFARNKIRKGQSKN
jgi:uncharacterized tellurite resistance protein B-like protein